jgi:integrase/recombinase XerD
MTRRGKPPPPYLQPRISKPVATWPDLDRAAWAMATACGSPLEPGGRASSWAPRSRYKAEIEYGHWLGWLERQGELDITAAPELRVTEDRVLRYLEDLQSRLSSFTVQTRLQGLGDVLRVMTETQQFSWISRAAGRLRARAVSIKNKRQKLKSSDQLVELGIALMKQADSRSETAAHAAALLYRNGLMIAFLAYCPVRVANLAAITIGKNLSKRGDSWWVIFTAEETKQKRPLEFPFPSSLTAALEHYLARYRSILAAKGAHHGSAGWALWISQDGGAFTAGGMAQAIKRLTKAAFGVEINPHLFRDCAATTIAIDDPEHAHVIAPILGHSSMTTSERHYNQAQTVDAGRQYHAVLAKSRRKRPRSEAGGDHAL